MTNVEPIRQKRTHLRLVKKDDTVSLASRNQYELRYQVKRDSTYFTADSDEEAIEKAHYMVGVAPNAHYLAFRAAGGDTVIRKEDGVCIYPPNRH